MDPGATLIHRLARRLPTLLQQPEHRLGMWKVRASGRSQPAAPSVALEQRDPELAAEPRDGGRDGWLRHIQALGSPLDGAAFGHSDEGAELSHGH